MKLRGINSSKRSQSNIIVIVLIILIILVLLVILWNIMMALLKQSQRTQAVFERTKTVTFTICNVPSDWRNPAGSAINISLSRGAENLILINETTITHLVNIPITSQVNADVFLSIDTSGSMNLDSTNSSRCRIETKSCCQTNGGCTTQATCNLCNGNFENNTCSIVNFTYNNQYCLTNNCSKKSVCEGVGGRYNSFTTPTRCYILPCCGVNNCSKQNICESTCGGTYSTTSPAYCYNISGSILPNNIYYRFHNQSIICNMTSSPTYSYICDHNDYCGGDFEVYPYTYSRIIYAKSALKKFIDKVFNLNPSHKIGLNTFIGSLNYSMSLGFTNDSIILKNRIEEFSIPSNNGTNICIGLRDAIKYLDLSSRKIKTIVLVSDGSSTRYCNGSEPFFNPVITPLGIKQELLNESAYAKSQNITVYTIGYGRDADNDTLKEIAQAGGGNYSFADLTGLDSVLNQIATSINTIVEQETIKIYEAELKIDHLRSVVYNDSETCIRDIYAVINPLETKQISIPTCGLIDITKIEIYLVSFTEDGREILKLLDTIQ